MEPKTITENLMYSTVRLSSADGKGVGTGFFFSFTADEGKSIPILITNKHVVRNNPREQMIFLLHTNWGNKKGEYDNVTITLSTEWHFHPSQDLCFCFANPLFESIQKNLGKSVVYRQATESHLWSRDQLENLSAIEEVTMVGYPTGLWDAKNNFPVFRHGHTACHPAIDFNENGIGLVDMACFPGSSGSPVFIINESSYRDKNNGIFLGQSRVILLGILYAVPVMNINGEILVQEVPAQQKVIAQSKTMINLGYYIKGYELLAFKPMIEHLAGTIIVP